ncbi:MAG: glycoside hydrolase family 99-like domain-containing protein [Spirochaetes bacterium]|nr:glycoside hydrolase family 99-like domain-containing protein [Spirochaetota bacterium]
MAQHSRPDIVSVYYPHWHTYDHGISWKGEGWTEWEGVKSAVPRFEGHLQPKKPVWGYFDESDPLWAGREIDLAADHGIDVFMYCWYWYSGVRNMEEALENGFLKSSNRSRMKFALMWANHDRRDQFCPEFGVPRTVWLPSRHSERDLFRVIDYCTEHYFSQPNYWRIDNRLFFSIFDPTHFINDLGGADNTRRLFETIDRHLERLGQPSMHWSAMATSPAAAQLAAQAGFHSTGTYNIASAGKSRPDFTERYEDVMEMHRLRWQQLSSEKLPYFPVVSMGWDPSPRCRADVSWPFQRNEYPYSPVVIGNTPERYEELLRDAARHLAQAPHSPRAVMLYAWNEWTEGGYLLPEERCGTAYLDAIKKIFGTSAAPA